VVIGKENYVIVLSKFYSGLKFFPKKTNDCDAFGCLSLIAMSFIYCVTFQYYKLPYNSVVA